LGFIFRSRLRDLLLLSCFLPPLGTVLHDDLESRREADPNTCHNSHGPAKTNCIDEWNDSGSRPSAHPTPEKIISRCSQ
jgi:hypothetical protein